MEHEWSVTRGTGVKWCARCGALCDMMYVDAYCVPGNEGDTQEAVPPCQDVTALRRQIREYEWQRDQLAGVLAKWQGPFAALTKPTLEEQAKERGPAGMVALVQLINEDEGLAPSSCPPAARTGSIAATRAYSAWSSTFPRRGGS